MSLCWWLFLARPETVELLLLLSRGPLVRSSVCARVCRCGKGEDERETHDVGLVVDRRVIEACQKVEDVVHFGVLGAWLGPSGEDVHGGEAWRGLGGRTGCSDDLLAEGSREPRHLPFLRPKRKKW